MNKKDIYKLIEDKNIWYEITDHEAVYNMEELALVSLPYPQCDAKNLFVRDDKKKGYYLITIKGDKRLDLKEFQNNYHLRRLSFASSDDLFKYLNLKPGSVTPFGLLNDKDLNVEFYLDKDFFGGNQIIGVHPCCNTATVWIKVNDLIDIIKSHGNKVNVVEFKED